MIVDENMMTSGPGVFTGGDASRGPSLVVHAVRDARKAAAAMMHFMERQITGPLVLTREGELPRGPHLN